MFKSGSILTFCMSLFVENSKSGKRNSGICGIRPMSGLCKNLHHCPESYLTSTQMLKNPAGRKRLPQEAGHVLTSSAHFWRAWGTWGRGRVDRAQRG